ncbi:MAG: ATP-dependent RNA helicase DbpA [Bdellovibrionaceae bacterium]|jgi:ATP-dependent RNA helicase DbpA|nr:ATP-dependent RNA helicase DbpA [Pseudobdellovibrionaceae bacterium]
MSDKFDVLPLKKNLLANLKNLDFHSMTPIQAESLPVILARKDVIAQAKTGSGKTAAYGLGILNALDISNKEVFSLVLCPTRELAEQVAKDLRSLGRTLNNLKILTLCGGISESIQEKSLQSGVHIAVGTPGRVLSLLENDALNVEQVKIFTLDEADRMLEMGFNEDIMKISSFLPKKRQSLLFSATYPETIRQLSAKIQKSAVEIKVDITHAADNIDQRFYEVKPDQDKNHLLFKILGQFRPDRVIVFCRTKKESYDISQFLHNRGIFAKCINGDLDQSERTKVLIQFSNESLSVLVATDVAARGLDIQELTAVVNYSLPSGAEAYIHRIGRTGRAGHKGLAFSFYSPGEEHRLEEIEAYTRKKCKVEDATQVTYSKKYDLVPPMQTMFISGGKKDKLRPGDIVGALVGEAKLDVNDVGNIAVLNILSYVAIRSHRIEQAIEKLKVGRIKKRKFKVGHA